MRKCVVIINPKSGNGAGIKDVKKIENIIENYNYEVVIKITEYQGHANLIIKNLDDDISLVISVGGDGTFSEVMNGNFERKKRLVLSHLPVGTTNDIGHMYGLGNNLYTNLKLILEGTVKEIDVGLINNHAFTYVASYGKFMDIPYDTPQELKKKLGYFAYMLEVFKRIGGRIPKNRINFYIDGEKYTGNYTFIIISNANRIAGINNFYNDIKLDDNKLEIMLCSLNRKIDIIKAFYILKTSGASHISGVEIYKTSNLKIEFLDNPKAWCTDGERFYDNSLIFEVKLENKVKMLIPNKFITRLFLNN